MIHDQSSNPPIESAHLDVRRLSVEQGRRRVLQDVSFAVPQGARIAVVGPNGAGKSTLFKAMVGLLPHAGGDVTIHNRHLGGHQDCVAYVPQREEVDWRFPVTVLDVVLMGRYGKRALLQRLTAEDRAVAMDSLKQLGMDGLAQRPIAALSGGQQQRVFIARALAQQPHILLMDEPFAGVDVTTQEATLALLDALRQQGVTVLVSTHDMEMAIHRFDQVLLLNHRVIAFGRAEAVFTPENLRAAFGGQVLFVNGAMVVDQCCQEEGHFHLPGEEIG